MIFIKLLHKLFPGFHCYKELKTVIINTVPSEELLQRSKKESVVLIQLNSPKDAVVSGVYKFCSCGDLRPKI